MGFLLLMLDVMVCDYLPWGNKSELSDKFAGNTTSLNNESSDLSIEVLVADLCAILQKIYPDPAAAPTFLVRSEYLSIGILIQISSACWP